jgi:protein phosphatase
MTADDQGFGKDRPGVAPFATYEFPPPSATVQVTFGAQSQRGRSRLVNEDHYLVFRLGRYEDTILTSLPDEVIGKRFEEYAYAMVVGDGFGGSGTGEDASRLAISTLVHLVRAFGKWNLRIDQKIANEIMGRAELFYRLTDRVVARSGPSLPSPTTMQTTLTATFGAGRDLFFAHVGHSRAYLLREGHLMRLTRDHTIGRSGTSNVPVGPIIDVNLAARDMKHIVTNAIGLSDSPGLAIEIERFELADRDVVLVCTNGLTDVVDEAIIGDVLSSGRTPDDECRSLVELAAASGAEDDVTALIAEYRIPA